MVFQMEKQYVMVKTRCFDVNNDNYHVPIIPNSESDCAKGYIDSYMGFKWKFKECEETE